MGADGPISDLGFDLFYPFTNDLIEFNPWIGDEFCAVMVLICTFWIIFFMGRTNKGYERRIVIFKRWMLIWAFLFNLRCITEISTVLPRPWRDTEEWAYCHDENASESMNNLSISMIASETWFYISGQTNVCYDFFFSGHTITVTLIALLVFKYSHCIYFKMIIWMMAVFTMIAIVAVRAHYTIDVWGGFIITLLLFKLFDISVLYKDGIFSKMEKPEIESVETETDDIGIGE